MRGRRLLRRLLLPLTPTLSPQAERGSSRGARRVWQLHAEPPGHAEMNGQHLAVIEMDEDILGASLEPLDRATREPLGEAGRKRKAQVLAALLHAHEPMSAKDRLKPKADGLDLGKLGHAASGAGIGLQPRDLDSGHRRHLVVVGGVP